MTTAKELRDQAKAAIQAAEEAQNRADALAAQARAAEQDEAATKHAATYADHSNRMFDEFSAYGMNSKQHELVYAKAYEMGHASGYEDVENYYSDLVDLAQQVIKAAPYK